MDFANKINFKVKADFLKNNIQNVPIYFRLSEQFGIDETNILTNFLSKITSSSDAKKVAFTDKYGRQLYTEFVDFAIGERYPTQTASTIVNRDLGSNQNGTAGYDLSTGSPVDNGDYYTFDGSSGLALSTNPNPLDEGNIDILVKFRIHQKSTGSIQCIWKSGGSTNGVAVGLDGSGSLSFYISSNGNLQRNIVKSDMIEENVWYLFYINKNRVALVNLDDDVLLFTDSYTCSPIDGTNYESCGACYGNSPLTSNNDSTTGWHQFFHGDVDFVKVYNSGDLVFPTETNVEYFFLASSINAKKENAFTFWYDETKKDNLEFVSDRNEWNVLNVLTPTDTGLSAYQGRPYFVEFNNNYYLFLEGYVNSGDPDQIYRFDTTDTITFSNKQLVIRNNSLPPYDTKHAWLGSLMTDGTKLICYYSGQDNSDICRTIRCESTDGLTFSNFQMVIDVNSEGTVDTQRVYRPVVKKVGSTYHCWYNGYDGSKYSVVYCTSSDGINWSNFQVCSFDKFSSSNTIFITDCKYEKGLFIGLVTYKTSDWNNSYICTSLDGINWKIEKQYLSTGTEGTHDTNVIYHPCLYKNLGYYCGNDSNNYFIIRYRLIDGELETPCNRVWRDYELVYHFRDTEFKDSTKYRRHATGNGFNSNSVSYGTYYGKGIWFDGTLSNYIDSGFNTNSTTVSLIQSFFFKKSPSSGTAYYLFNKRGLNAENYSDFPLTSQISASPTSFYLGTSSGNDYTGDVGLFSTLTYVGLVNVSMVSVNEDEVQLILNTKYNSSYEPGLSISSNTRNWCVGRASGGTNVGSSYLTGLMKEAWLSFRRFNQDYRDFMVFNLRDAVCWIQKPYKLIQVSSNEFGYIELNDKLKFKKLYNDLIYIPNGDFREKIDWNCYYKYNPNYGWSCIRNNKLYQRIKPGLGGSSTQLRSRFVITDDFRIFSRANALSGSEVRLYQFNCRSMLDSSAYCFVGPCVRGGDRMWSRIQSPGSSCCNDVTASGSFSFFRGYLKRTGSSMETGRRMDYQSYQTFQTGTYCDHDTIVNIVTYQNQDIQAYAYIYNWNIDWGQVDWLDNHPNKHRIRILDSANNQVGFQLVNFKPEVSNIKIKVPDVLTNYYLEVEV